MVKMLKESCKDIKTNLKKHGLSDKKITSKDLTKWDKEAKRKKSKPIKITEGIEIDFDQENQEPKEEELSKKVKNRKKKWYNIK